MKLFRNSHKLGAWLLALSQVFFIAGCNRGGTGGSGSGGAASTAAGSTAGVNMGQIVYDLVHHNLETSGETAKVTALEARRAEFVDAVNRILPSGVSQNLFPTLKSLLPLVDDGTLEAAVDDVDAILVALINDQPALDGLTKLLSSTQSGARGDSRTMNMMLGRLLAYPELEDVVKASAELIQAHDGVDDQGQANGERNLVRELQALVSRQLLGYQPAAGTTSSLTSMLETLSDELLAERPMEAFANQLGAPAWAVRLDVHGNPQVAVEPATGKLPAPFKDDDGDGAADVDAQNRPVDAAGAVIDIASFGTDGARDSYGRAMAPGGRLYYDYFDAKHTLLSELLLLTGELLKKDVPGAAMAVLDGATSRVPHDNGTADPRDDYETLDPDCAVVDLAWAQLELVKRTPLSDLLRGLAEVVKRDPAKFEQMVDDLLVAIKKASAAASQVPASGSPQQLVTDLLPLLEDALRPKGRNVSAVRALLEAFNTQQRALRTLPVTFARMMKYHDYKNRILADATHKSVMQRILEMMERANQCNAVGMGNMADFYLNAMAGNQSVLGITVHIGTIHFLLDIGFLRNLLCSGIRADDVRALKDFNDSGALDAMKPIAKVFSDRGETPLLKNIMLGLGKHYDGVVRPLEPTNVAVLESGAIEKLFEVIDAMTQQQVPGSSAVVADVLADTLQAVIDSSTPAYDRKGVAHSSLAKLLLAPIDRLNADVKARNLQPQLDTLFNGLGDVLLQTYVDGQGVERWKWEGLKCSLGTILEAAADMIPVNATDRARWAAERQIDTVRLLSSRDVVVVVDVMTTIAASPQKAVLNKAIANLFTPKASAQVDVFGAILSVAAEKISVKAAHPSHTSPIDQQALADVLHFFGRQLDPALDRFQGVATLLRKLIAADSGLLLLNLARNALDKGPNGTDPSPAEVCQSVFADIDRAGGGSGGMTSAELKDMLQTAHDFIVDPVKGLPSYIARIKSRQGAPAHP